jgi:hypothetical protein
MQLAADSDKRFQVREFGEFELFTAAANSMRNPNWRLGRSRITALGGLLALAVAVCIFCDTSFRVKVAGAAGAETARTISASLRHSPHREGPCSLPPSTCFLAAKRCRSAIRPTHHLGAVVAAEDQDGVVRYARRSVNGVTRTGAIYQSRIGRVTAKVGSSEIFKALGMGTRSTETR